MGIVSRTKGIAGEREVIQLLQPVVDAAYAKHRPQERAPKLTRNLAQCQDGGHDLNGLPWAAIEVKKCAKPDLGKWWAQTLRQAEQMTQAQGSMSWVAPILIYKIGRDEWRARWTAGVASQSIGAAGSYAIVAAIVDTDLPTFARWLAAELGVRLAR